jgi:hypothetical protein
LAAYFGSRLGADLSDVRIHDDPAAAVLADAADALAFTIGSHVFFNRGEYRPSARAGRALLAHELAHAVDAAGPVRLLRQPKAQGGLTEDVLNKISADADELSHEVASTFPNRARILIVFATWDDSDRMRSAALAEKAPHIDALCIALQARPLSATTTAMDMVWHVMRASSTTEQLFDSYMSHSMRFKAYQPGPPLRSFWQSEAKEADRLRLLVLAGKYDEVQRGLDAVSDPNRDDVAVKDVEVELVTYLNYATLVSMFGTASGRDLLERLYDELTAGITGAARVKQAQRIENARRATVTPEMFQAALAGGHLRVFPYRKGGFAARPAIPWASFIGGGKVFVRMSMNVRTDPTFDEDTKTLPLEVFTDQGLVLAADQIVGVRFYDEGGGRVKPVPVPALRLVALKNEGVTHTFEKIGETPALALSGVGGGVQVAGLGAKTLLWADRAAIVAGVLGSAISENRGWFIRRFGEPGRQFVEAVETVNSAVAIFGIVRVAMSLPKLVSGLREGLRGLRRSAAEVERDLTTEQRAVVTNSTMEADELATRLEGIQQAQAQTRGVKASTPSPPPMGEPPTSAATPAVTPAEPSQPAAAGKVQPEPTVGGRPGGQKPQTGSARPTVGAATGVDPPAPLAELQQRSGVVVTSADAEGGVGWKLVKMSAGDEFEAFGLEGKRSFKWVARVPEENWTWARRGNQLVPEWYTGRDGLAKVMVRYRIKMNQDVTAAMSKVADQRQALERLGPAKFQYFLPEGFERFATIERIEEVTVLTPGPGPKP